MVLDTGGFRGTERFRIVKRLGAGAMGEVYAVHDRERDETVALKTLLWADPAAIYRLKKEFRALADVSHPNLVALHELIAEGDEWFFTMELVEGVTFVDYVRADGLQLGRLRDALRQLVEAVAAIHAGGRLHRDLKPSNVLVTREGRVVVLDFGIASDLVSSPSSGDTIEEGVWGTAAYMSPEQADGQPTPASDWYAVGVMLYEALTGATPYTGNLFQVLAEKLIRDPVPPDQLVPGLPADLVQLCMALVARKAEDRPGSPELLRRLGAGTEPEAAEPPPTEGADLLVGREHHLAELERALEQTRAGHARTVYVTGPSGMGKSTLVHRFLDQLGRERRAVVLTGRCFSRESVPYKAVDGVIDSLSVYLRSLTKIERQGLLSEDLPAAVRLFPVLGRVDGIAELREAATTIQDPVELRRRGFAALRGLLGRLAAGQPLVLHIDDLQWGDADSVTLLDGLLGPPEPPALLLIASFRSEDVEKYPFLGAMLASSDGVRVRELPVGPLSPAETGRLVAHLMGIGFAEGSPAVEAIVRESAGSPFLAEELVRYLRGTGAKLRTGGGEVSLGEMLAARIATLPAGAQALLDALAVAAHPLDPLVAHEATGLRGDERAHLALLRGRRLVRSSGAKDEVEVYHDRIRETLAKRIEAERVPAIHLRLAAAMENRRIDNPDALYEHYVAAGHPDLAGPHAVRAGDKAARALAFERAAGFYARALELAAPTIDRRELQLKLGDALANAGRGTEAADVYLEAARDAPPLEALDRRRRAAEQLLRCGHVDRGLEVTRSALAPLGLQLARSPRHALLRILARRAFLRVRGLGFTERPAVTIDPLTLCRVDVCWALAIGLSRVDYIRATDFQVLHLHQALKAGELYRVVRGLSAEASFLATGGARNDSRASRLVELAQRLAHRAPQPEAAAFAQFAAAFLNFWTGRWSLAREHCERAELLFRERCAGVIWEINTAQGMVASSLYYMGEFAELARRVPGRMREAKQRGDLYAAADVAAGRSIVAWLAADDVSGARDAVREAMRAWSPRGFHLQHYFRLFAEDQVDLYAGQGMAAWRRTTEQWRDLARSLVLRVQLIRTEAMHLAARCALAAATAATDPEPHLGHATRQAARIRREGIFWADPLAHLVNAAVAAARGDDLAATRLLVRAIAGFEEAGMGAYAAAARRRSGALLGGDDGRALVAEADAWLARRGVANPQRMTAMLAPGFPGPD